MATVTFYRGTATAPVTDGAISFNTSTKQILVGNGSTAQAVSNYVDRVAASSTTTFPITATSTLYLLVLKRGGSSTGYAYSAVSVIYNKISCQQYCRNNGVAANDVFYGTPVVVYTSDRKYVLAQPTVTRAFNSSGTCTGTTVSWKTCPTSASSSEGTAVSLNSSYSTSFYLMDCV